MNSPLQYLTPEQHERFQQDGYLVIPGFLTADEVSRTRADIARVSEQASANAATVPGFGFEPATEEEAGGHGSTNVLRKIQGAAFFVPAVREVFTAPKMLDCMQDLMGPEIYYHSSKVMFKGPGGSAKPWHQDAAYWREFAPNQITVWIAIDDASEENGCVWAIPGSHKLGLIPHVKRELQVEESRINLKEAIPVPVPAGGMLIFHSLVLHMSQKNLSDKTRWAIICDYDCLPNPCSEARNYSLRPEGMREDNVWPLRTR